MSPRAAAEPAKPPPTTPSEPPGLGAAQPGRPRPALRQPTWRALAALALLLLLGLLLVLRALAMQPHIDATWRAGGSGQLQLMSSPLPQLRALVGARLQHISDPQGRQLSADGGLMQRSPRWSVDDRQRAQQQHTQLQLATMLRSASVTLHFADGRQATLAPGARGLRRLGPFIWPAAAAAMALLLCGAAVLLQHPLQRNLPYAALVLCQAGSLLAIAVEALPGLGQPLAYLQHGAWLRWAFDLGSAASMVHLATLQPLRLPRAAWIAAGAWAACAVLAALAALQAPPLLWWWTQAAMLGSGALTLALMAWSYRLEPNPFALLMRRLVGAATLTLLVLSVAAAASSRDPDINAADAASGAVIWYVFMASMALLLPVFARTRPLLREMVLLSGTSTLATSLQMLFTTIFGLGIFASMSLAMFVALATYAGTRRWLLQPMRGPRGPATERMFERLHRALRDVEARPRDSAELLTRLLRDLFEPLQVHTLAQAATHSRVLGDGSALLVPQPSIDDEHDGPPSGSAIVLRFAEHGRRMFSRDDARLTDRVVEQLRRAVAYDKAVERGRSEERARIAQDLHDDIGARLLTLMYQAQSPEMEDYIRHTLKDLKTLTRGLASSEQNLSHATAEWKADITRRLAAARIELKWSFAYDSDLVLSMMQWSALTRVLRELISNIIQHSGATRVEITGVLQAGLLRLTLADDGIGRNPQNWSHGLGLGGVRKRVRLLRGEVQWRERDAAGIVCTVLIPDLAQRH
jgi:signal transduction histidine kinase